MWCLLHRLGRRRGAEGEDDEVLADESAMLLLIQVYFCTLTQGKERGALPPSLFTRFISRSRQQARTLACLSHCFPFLSRPEAYTFTVLSECTSVLVRLRSKTPGGQLSTDSRGRGLPSAMVHMQLCNIPKL